MAEEGYDSRASSTTQLPYPGLEWHRNGRALVGDGTGTPLSTAGPAPVPVPYVPPWRAMTLGHTTVTLTLEREFPTGGESLHRPCSGCPHTRSAVVPSTQGERLGRTRIRWYTRRSAVEPARRSRRAEIASLRTELTSK